MNGGGSGVRDKRHVFAAVMRTLSNAKATKRAVVTLGKENAFVWRVVKSVSLDNRKDFDDAAWEWANTLLRDITDPLPQGVTTETDGYTNIVIKPTAPMKKMTTPGE